MAPIGLSASVLFLLVFCFCFSALCIGGGPANVSKFDDLSEPSWAVDHFMYDGEVVKLKLDHNTGAGFASKNKYMLGKVGVEMKLVEGDSAGTVNAFYMSSEGPNHSEFDFEFLGNSSGEPYLLQTNIYVGGVGNREQRIGLWFDPTQDFHSYSLSWSTRHVVFMVDEIPIRVYGNVEKPGLAFPDDEAMGVYSSIWNADDWATQGGRVKTDWTHAPFVASYRGFAIHARQCGEDDRRCAAGNPWDEPALSQLSIHQTHQLEWVRANHMVYDYCTDSQRFPSMLPECVHHHHRRL